MRVVSFLFEVVTTVLVAGAAVATVAARQWWLVIASGGGLASALAWMAVALPLLIGERFFIQGGMARVIPPLGTRPLRRSVFLNKTRQ